jgi:hypothetical protein
MKTIDIVEGFNKFFIELYPNRGFFVSKLNVEQGKISKLYKTYTLEVWYIDGTYKKKVLHISKSARIPDNMDDIVIRDLNIELTKAMFKNYSTLLEYGV